MLVLTRRPGENIRIGPNIVITVLKVAPGQVKIGIEAPPDVVVHREEIYKRIQLETSTPSDSVPPAADAPDAPDPPHKDESARAETPVRRARFRRDEKQR